MSTREIVDLLRAVAGTLAGHGRGARWYLFGSATRAGPSPKDVDVLVVCDGEETVRLVRAELRELCLSLPLDLLLLTRGEEAELGFVEGEDCLAIFPGGDPLGSDLDRGRDPPVR